MAQHYDIIGRGWSFPVDINGRGGIAMSQGVDEIEEAIAIILSTPKRSRVMRPEFGCRIHELVFAPLEDHTFTLAAFYVREALEMWEPRIELLNVIAFSDQEVDAGLLVYIEYRIRATHDERALVYPFYTIPGDE